MKQLFRIVIACLIVTAPLKLIAQDFLFFEGTEQQVTKTLTNPYDGTEVFLDGIYNLNTSSYQGTGLTTLIGTSSKDYLSIENDSGEQTIKDTRVIIAGNGNDIMNLASAIYTLSDTQILGGEGNDIIWANIGNDILLGANGDDHLNGGPGNDRIRGENDNDIIFGGIGNDILDGGSGINFLSGGEGEDSFFSFGGTIDEAPDASLDFFLWDTNDLLFSQSGLDLILTDTNSLLDVTIKNQFDGLGSGLDFVKDSSGATLYDLRAISPVPEPSTVVGIALSAGLLFFFGKRRKGHFSKN